MRSDILWGGVALLVIGGILFFVGQELVSDANNRILENPFDPNKWQAADDQKNMGNLLEMFGEIMLVFGVIVAAIGAIVPKEKETPMVGAYQVAAPPPIYSTRDYYPPPAERTSVAQASGRKYCESCGRAVPVDSSFCPYCGKDTQRAY